MVGPSGDLDRRAAWRELRRVQALVARTLEEELLRARGLPLTWFEVLQHLDEAGGRLRMQQLADEVGLTRSGCTRLVDRLTRDGLVRREPCPDDGRGLFATLTGSGRDALGAGARVHQRALANHFARGLGQDDVRALRALLGRVLAGEGAADPVPGPAEGPLR